MFKALFTLLLFTCLLTGCATVKRSSTYSHKDSSAYSKLDSSWVSLKKLDVFVPGAATLPLNLDSLRRSWITASSTGRIPTQLTGQVFTQKDATGRAELRYWFDSLGNLYASCAAKDQTIQALVEQNNRLVKEQGSRAVMTETAKSKIVRRLPFWVWLTIGGGLLLLITGFFLKLLSGANAARAATAAASKLLGGE